MSTPRKSRSRTDQLIDRAAKKISKVVHAQLLDDMIDVVEKGMQIACREGMNAAFESWAAKMQDIQQNRRVDQQQHKEIIDAMVKRWEAQVAHLHTLLKAERERTKPKPLYRRIVAKIVLWWNVAAYKLRTSGP